MNKLFHLHCFEALKTEVLSVCKIDSVTLSECRTISFLVMKQTQKCVSEITLKRVFGFMISNFPPSLYTLDALSLFCGHNNWEAFCEVHTEDSSINSEHIVEKLATPNSDSVLITSIEELLNDPLVGALINGASSTLIVKANAPIFTVLNYNTAFELATSTQKRNIKGMSFWDAFDHKLSGSHGPTLVREALNKVIEKKEILQLDPVHYNILSPILHIISLNWWVIKITPIIYDQDVTYLMLNVFNISDRILN